MEVSEDLTTFTYGESSDYVNGFSTAIIPISDGETFMITDAVSITCVCLISMLGFIGNGLVLYIFNKYKDMRASTAAPFVMLQAGVDLTNSLVVFIQEVLVFSITENYHHVKQRVICKVFGSGLLFWLSVEASTISLVLLSTNRYVKIVHPFSNIANWNPQKVAYAVSIPWVLTAAWSTFSLTYTTDLWGTICLSQGFHIKFALSHLISFCCLFFAVPTFYFVYCYTRILIVLKQRKAALLGIPEGKQKEFQTKKHRSEVQLTKTMALVCLAFFLCWAPVVLLMLTRLFLSLVGEVDKYTTLIVFLSYFNCCTNPVIYGFTYRGFSRRLKDLIMCKGETI